ncbi:branched-chain amino acid aminotransferase [Sphaceloma murrayae]|uniref:Branched-chain amino acid aminotransferase n=1 Tax=Sphaceloma murrayae TaxID=2082308 RepID=A0A2K1QP93_9PEZI|nr:branched-chain amino acid aminotransferase [Sphaceloma murrayae]
MPSTRSASFKARQKPSSGGESVKQSENQRRGSWYVRSRTGMDDEYIATPPGSYLQLSDIERKQKEILFTFAVDIPLQGDWKRSEEYWLQKDREMLDYLRDFPISRWLIDANEAKLAFTSMQARFDRRKKGVSVYADGIPGVSDTPATVHTKQSAGLRTRVEVVDRVTLPLNRLTSAIGATPSKSTSPKKPSKLSTTYVRDEEVDEAPAASLDDARRPSPVGSAPVQRPIAFTPINGRETLLSAEFSNGAQKSKLSDEAFLQSSDRTPSKKLKYGNEETSDDDEPRLSNDSRKRKPSDETVDLTMYIVSKKSRKVSDDEPVPPPYDKDPAERVLLYEFFPWEMDHAVAEPEEWDDSIYEPSRLEHLRNIHRHNLDIVSQFMANGKHGARRRKLSAIQAGCSKAADLPSYGKIKPAERPGKSKSLLRKFTGVDHPENCSINLIPADTESARKLQALPSSLIRDAIEAAMLDPFDDTYKGIEVTHNPGDSILDNLDLPRISIMDIARTRLQVRHHRVLTKRAAECIIDICPDLLITHRLLQVMTETEFGNTSTQIRLGYNGTMLSDSTLTKRVSTLLGLEFDKGKAAAAAESNKDFKKVNRDNYNKYNAWRAWKRANGTPRPSSFDLAEAAQKYAIEKNGKHGISSEASENIRHTDESDRRDDGNGAPKSSACDID